MTSHQADIGNRLDGPDLVVLGADATALMCLLWAVALGRPAVGIGSGYQPPAGACWHLTADVFHQLELLDALMFERYGAAGVPRRGDGRLLRLAECWYLPDSDRGPAPVAEVLGAAGAGRYIAAPVERTESVDERWVGGVGRHQRTLLPVEPPGKADPDSLGAEITAVLAAPRPFRVLATDLVTLLRRYVQAVERLDRQRGVPLRVRLLNRHRVPPDGFAETPAGLRIRAEPIPAAASPAAASPAAASPAAASPGGTSTGAGTGGAVGGAGRDRADGPVDLGVPELFVVSQGVDGPDARRLGLRTEPVLVDRADGQGPVPARSDVVTALLAADLPVPVRRRIGTEPDEDRDEYWVRQYAVAHPYRPGAVWLVAEVPDFQTFDPVELGRLPAGTDPAGPEFAAAYRQVLHEFCAEQAARVLGPAAAPLRPEAVHCGPELHCRAPAVAADPRLAGNGVAAGRTYGSGQVLNAEDCLVGVVGHSARVLRYWQDRAAGAGPAAALDRLAAGIRADTAGWLAASAADLTEADHTHFLPGCYEEIEAARAQRWSLRDGC